MNETVIDKWIKTIFPKPGDIFRIKTIADIFPLVDKSSSAENIFLILYNKGLISAHKSRVDLIKEEMESGLTTVIYTNIQFHITDKGILFLTEPDKTIDNQLKLDL